QVRGRTLSAGEVDGLCREGLRVAAAFGGPLDIEWTRKNGRFHLLQARPITAAALRQGPRVVWDNSNIQESYCGVTTPLTFSFARRGYAGVYRQTLAVAGLPPKTIADPLFDNLLGLIRGRVYYNLNN